MTTINRGLIVAFDPGVTTGVAWLRDGQFASAQFSETELYEWVDERCLQFNHVQIEQFVINAGTIRKTVVYDSLFLIGYLRYCAWRCDFKFEFSKPADVMSSFPDSALKRAGWYQAGKGHSNDAARHLAWYCVKQRLMPGSVFLS